MDVETARAAMIMEKWVCKVCGHEQNEKPHKNETCGENGCKGRLVRTRLCKCGTWFVASKGDRHYCSDRCAGFVRRNPRVGKVEVECTQCGEKFLRFASGVGKKNFCSKDCQRAFESETKQEHTCEYCGRPFMVRKKALEHTNASGRFCSTECYWDSMKREQAVYTGFRAAKKRYFGNKQFCAICGTTKKIQIHHIIPNRLTRDQRKENLIPLCPLHHNRVERMTARLHVLFKDDYETELWYLNNILRSRQMATAAAIKEIQHG